MFGALRMMLGLLILAVSVYAAFNLPLGSRTLAEHVDRIGRTDEAKDLLDGTRSTLHPVLDDVKDRVLGEHVEAPTRATETKPARSEVVPARAGVSTAEAAGVPGRGSRQKRP